MSQPRTNGALPDQTGVEWRRLLRYRLMGMLVLKVIALTLLWVLFFSPSHRVEINPPNLEQQFRLRNSP
jgi:hypothetical protein